MQFPGQDLKPRLQTLLKGHAAADASATTGMTFKDSSEDYLTYVKNNTSDGNLANAEGSASYHNGLRAAFVLNL